MNIGGHHYLILLFVSMLRSAANTRSQKLVSRCATHPFMPTFFFCAVEHPSTVDSVGGCHPVHALLCSLGKLETDKINVPAAVIIP